MTTNNSNYSVEYISVVETASILRVALKAVFGTAVKFSVKSDKYSGGASIDVRWKDGPTEKQVGAITKRFEGATFDSMIDLKSSTYTEWQGRVVRFGADYIFLRRDYGRDAYQQGVTIVAQRWGVEAPPIRLTVSGQPFCDPMHGTSNLRLMGGYTFSDLVYQELASISVEPKQQGAK